MGYSLTKRCEPWLADVYDGPQLRPFELRLTLESIKQPESKHHSQNYSILAKSIACAKLCLPAPKNTDALITDENCQRIKSTSCLTRKYSYLYKNKWPIKSDSYLINVSTRRNCLHETESSERNNKDQPRQVTNQRIGRDSEFVDETYQRHLWRLARNYTYTEHYDHTLYGLDADLDKAVARHQREAMMYNQGEFIERTSQVIGYASV